ncbi:MAG: hypothetical protein KA746_08670 [Pyrinomonadaceae bacterium]|nr:hypothetical protein [Pyrinomonadaceae bacterium]MBP6213743.1 hypothetical protein [Pyrinomonadaceae bacterium]
MKSGKASPAPVNSTPALATLEKDIADMRTADFAFIYVLRRKDGGVLDPEDKSVVRTQTDQVNRRVSSDGGKAVVVGSNFAIAPEKMTALYDRFAIQNYSPVEGVNGEKK